MNTVFPQDSEHDAIDSITSYQSPINNKKKSKTLTQAQLNNLNRDLVLLKDSVQFIDSHLDESNLHLPEMPHF